MTPQKPCLNNWLGVSENTGNGCENILPLVYLAAAAHGQLRDGAVVTLKEQFNKGVSGRSKRTSRETLAGLSVSAFCILLKLVLGS